MQYALIFYDRQLTLLSWREWGPISRLSIVERVRYAEWPNVADAVIEA